VGVAWRWGWEWEAGAPCRTGAPPFSATSRPRPPAAGEGLLASQSPQPSSWSSTSSTPSVAGAGGNETASRGGGNVTAGGWVGVGFLSVLLAAPGGRVIFGGNLIFVVGLAAGGGTLAGRVSSPQAASQPSLSISAVTPLDLCSRSGLQCGMSDGVEDDVRMETGIMWTDALWMNQHAFEGLHLGNVLEYFLLSNFADPRCMNVVATDRGLTAFQESPPFYRLGWLHISHCILGLAGVGSCPSHRVRRSLRSGALPHAHTLNADPTNMN
jgi:hypothetical protein